ncbi:oxygen-dependent protoporphyrinogen oxidase [Saccharomonospora amisosensis]|uniref:Coproporphyrinogen III oxidase n=1 Tax=Saccharomonospora amisosensis TaxID=1128677 RepID=A0A7X5ZRA8_9PSEU|nr:protoporphyrinogen oxidase [Saccharomonospora amisosensis]NIJ12668.1 oxygen-dependent protoporphyrinogen oxidase [Saccharomonospora amisosensis]
MRVAVVGGGISGLVAAYRLRTALDAAATITICEATGELGGKLRTGKLAGRAFDVGAEAFLARRPEAVELARELGLRAELTHPAPVSATVRAGGRTLPLPRHTVMGVPAAPDAVRDVLSAAGAAAVAAEASLPGLSLPREAEGDVSLGELLRQRFGDELVDRLVDPLLAGVYAGGSDGLGMRATMPALAAAVDAGARSLTEAAANLLPSEPGGSPVFATLTGGLGTLVNRLAAASRAEVRFGAPVRALHRRGDGWRLVLGAVAAAHATADAELDADAVVLAVPAPAASRLLAEVAQEASAAFAEVELASMAVVGLALPPRTELPRASGVLIGEGELRADGTPFTAKAFTFSARKWGHHAGQGAPVLIRGSVGRFGDTAALRARDEELVRLVRSDLAELTGCTAEPVDTLVQRWGGGLPQYGVGHLRRVRRIERAVAEIDGLEVAGATLHGVGIPACIATADAAVARLVGR